MKFFEIALEPESIKSSLHASEIEWLTITCLMRITSLSIVKFRYVITTVTKYVKMIAKLSNQANHYKKQH